MYEGTYLERIPETALLQEIERYRNPCPFVVDIYKNPWRGLALLRLTSKTDWLDIPYSEIVPGMFTNVENGPDGVYVWEIKAYSAGGRQPLFHKSPSGGKWIEVRRKEERRYSFMNEPQTIAFIPWCYDLREALVRVLKDISKKS